MRESVQRHLQGFREDGERSTLTMDSRQDLTMTEAGAEGVDRKRESAGELGGGGQTTGTGRPRNSRVIRRMSSTGREALELEGV